MLVEKRMVFMYELEYGLVVIDLLFSFFFFQKKNDVQLKGVF